jgi:DNA primase
MATTSLDRVLQALGAKGSSLRRYGAGWLAQCPAHADRSPSLSIREGRDGHVLMHCFAGCETREVLGALGLSFSDLFPRKGDNGGFGW